MILMLFFTFILTLFSIQPTKVLILRETSAYFYEKLSFSMTFSLTSSIFVAVFFTILNS